MTLIQNGPDKKQVVVVALAPASETIVTTRNRIFPVTEWGQDAILGANQIIAFVTV